MRFLVDAQLPDILCAWLAARGHEALHVSAAGDPALSDWDIAAWASREGYIVISKDQDFVALRRTHAIALVWLRCGNTSTKAMRDWLDERWSHIEAALGEGQTLVELH